MGSTDLFGGILLHLQACNNLEHLKLLLSSAYTDTFGSAGLVNLLRLVKAARQLHTVELTAESTAHVRHVQSS